MLKKTLLAVVLAGTSFASQANWQAGAGYMNLSDDDAGIDISLDGIYGSIGYKFDSGNDFYFMPELRIGTGIGDDKVNVFGTNVKIEMDSFIALSVRGQYDFNNGFYLYAAPSYANLEVTASAGGVSESGDDWEFGFGGGAGYQFSKTMAAELSYEQFDGTDAVSVALKFDF
ncbi:outer membrane beta-barrel protein [Pseudoalteromonas sp. BDTF-M6]|uniref:outer membrane protein n=1 Tax=Pseudoalteromonas sp. BDTF-M6 TaxID=2796132 RepID=UPI001BB0B78B|nr:outer membrane beta-barrel protein [Pseudoalteromonas sp. BDTF-M6]MBS3796452.1 outer membrane beta-barrel protein [Pseudoalteromonas sp. BDTF-M6]